MQAISASLRTGGPYHTPVWYGNRARGTAAGTNASAILRKTTETAEVKTFFFISLCLCFLRNIITLEACNSVFNMRFTQKDQ